jgi:predicted ATPase/DNA-binding SARP family transcriptional activator/Tfp pilus assembly protein PilF
MTEQATPALLRLLGPPVLEHAGGSLPFAAERRFQLLALLAHQAEWVSRERLAALFWPEHSADAARRNLRKVLYRLRELPGLPPLLERGGSLRWPVATDLQAFEQALARGELAAALALWRGEPWQGLDNDGALADWLAFERLRLRSLWREALLTAAPRSDDPGQLLRYAELALAHDPLDEEALRLAMRAWLSSGRRAEAKAAYLAFSRRLAEALGLEPALQTRELLRDPQAGAQARSEVVERPAPDADLIGRQAEQHELAALLAQPGCRWITLIGPGGIGKSRLLAHAFGPRSGSAAILVPLEDLTSPAQVAVRLADRLGIVLTGEADPHTQLAQALEGCEHLIALDNIEHLLAAVPALAELQQRCPGLRFVASSRERTGARGEWLMPIAGLPFPDADDADRADAFDAVRLFVQRARETNPRFDLGAEREGVVELCAFVEGLPLAIELAAVWTRHFRAAEIARELKNGGEMLNDAAGGGMASRQRSMAATFEHSWQLLVPAERQALAALAVCRGGFTRETARVVGGATLALLTALIDKSLLRRDERSPAADPANARFGMHPLVQEFALGKLAQAPGSRDEAERRHASCFAQLLARMPGPDQQARRNAFRLATAPELDNAAAAWRWAVANRQAGLLVLMVTPLRILYFSSARRAEGLAMLNQAEALFVAEHSAALALLDLSRGILEYSLGRFVEASEFLRRALQGLRRRGDKRDYRNCLAWLGQSLTALGRLEAARRCLEQGLASARQDRDPMSISDCLGNLGGVDYTLGRFDSAIAAMQESLELRLAAGGDVAMLLNNLGLAQLHAGRPALAIETLQRGIEASRREPNPQARAFFPYNLAQAYLLGGDVARAETCAFESARAIADGEAPALAISTNALLARIALRRGDTAHARDLLAAATLDARARRIRPLQVGLAIHWAEWLYRSGDNGRADALLCWASGQNELEHPDRMLGDEIRAAIDAAGVQTMRRGAAPPPSDTDAAVIIDALTKRREPGEQPRP